MKFLKINITPELLENELLTYLVIYTESFDLLTFGECSDAIEVIQEYMPKLADPTFADTQRRASQMMIKLINRRSKLGVKKIYKPVMVPPGSLHGKKTVKN